MLKKVFAYIFLLLGVFVSIFPFYFMFAAATNSNREILRNPPSLLPGGNLLQNFASLNDKINILRVVGNSMFEAVLYTALSIILFSMAGYAFAKYDFKGKNAIFMIIMLCMMLPPEVLYVPMFKMMAALGWVNSYQAILLPPLANAFGIFLMRQNMLSFPDSVLEAARIDGLNEVQIFFKMVVPNVKAAISALGIYMFMSCWNSFMWPLIILGEKDMYTLPVALAFLDGIPNKKDYGAMMLAASIAIIPIMLIYLAFQKQFISGVMGGAVKE